MSGGTYTPERAAFSQLPLGLEIGMAANEVPSEDDIIGLNAAGYGIVLDGSDVGARVLGVHNEARSTANAANGANVVRLLNGYGAAMPMSADAGDSFLSTDYLLPAYVSAAKELGKLGTDAGIARPVAGLYLYTDRGGKPVFWIGDVAQLVARGLLIADAFTFASYPIADAAANSTLAERVIARVTKPGVVTGVAYAGAALAASNTDYGTVVIAKRSALDSYAAATTIATYDTRAANQGAAAAFTPAAFGLSATAAALRVVPGDVITIVETKASSGQQFAGVIDVLGKVI